MNIGCLLLMIGWLLFAAGLQSVFIWNSYIQYTYLRLRRYCYRCAINSQIDQFQPTSFSNLLVSGWTYELYSCFTFPSLAGSVAAAVRLAVSDKIFLVTYLLTHNATTQIVSNKYTHLSLYEVAPCIPERCQIVLRQVLPHCLANSSYGFFELTEIQSPWMSISWLGRCNTC